MTANSTDARPDDKRLVLKHPVSILMPVCDEADVIESVIHEWHSSVMSYLPVGSELVLDDGDSNDGTVGILERLQEQYPYLRILLSFRSLKNQYPGISLATWDEIAVAEVGA